MAPAPVFLLSNTAGVKLSLSLVNRNVSLFCFFFSFSDWFVLAVFWCVQSLGFGSGSRSGWVQTGLTVWFNRVSS